MDGIVTWIIANPMLQAVAIIVAVATAAYYAWKALVWTYALIGSAVVNGTAAAIRSRISKAKAETQLAVQDTHLLVTSLVRRVINLVYIVLISAVWFSLTQGEQPPVDIATALRNAVNLTLGIIGGVMFGGLANFVGNVEKERRRILGKSEQA